MTPAPHGRLSASTGIHPYPEYTNQQIGSLNHFMMPLTTTPEPIVRTSTRKITRRKPKPIKLVFGTYCLDTVILKHHLEYCGCFRNMELIQLEFIKLTISIVEGKYQLER